jgi:GntR family transcriptional repressor for pyruvate dehydrogenase complex
MMMERIPGVMKTVKRVSIVDSIAEQLMDAIHSKQFPAGSKIPPERELTVMLGVSRTALREAVKQLESLGILSVRQGDGTYVNSNAEQQERMFRSEMKSLFSIGNISMRDFVEARVTLEAKAASLAVNAPEKELDHLSSFIETMENSLDDRAGFSDCDINFHKYIIKLSGNPVLFRFAWSIEDLLVEQIKRSIETHEHLHASLDSHIAIVEALLSKDAARAEQAVRNHLNRVPACLVSAVLKKTRENVLN